MHIPPIVERELRVAMRKVDVRSRRWKISLICCIVSAILLLAGWAGGENFIRGAHPILFLSAIYFSVISTFALAGAMFVQERQEQTLGFLFLAGMTMPEIFLTKIAGTFLIAITTTLSFIPFMSIPFLAGGVSFDVFWATVWCLPNLVILALALCTFASVLCKEESAAASIAQIIAAVLCLFTPALHWLGAMSGVKMSDAWLIISPAYGPWLIVENFNSASASQFWWNTLLTLAWSISFFIAAAIILRHTWRIQTTSADNTLWQKIIPRWLTRSEQWKQQRAALLDQNPFTWLASHDRHPERLAWTMLAGTAGIWILGWCLIGDAWINVPNFFITATIVNIELTGVVLFAAAKRLGEDRRSGALELLLVTPITPLQIVKGQIEALRHQFRAISLTTAALSLGLALFGLTLRPWNWRALIVYALIWALLIWFALRLSHRNSLRATYAALVSGRPGFAVWKCTTGGNIWSWWWVYFNVKNLFSHVHGFPSGDWFELCIVGLGIILWALSKFFYRHDPTMSPYSEPNLKNHAIVHDFRRIAQSAIPTPDDKRFKNWRPTSRFPI